VHSSTSPSLETMKKIQNEPPLKDECRLHRGTYVDTHGMRYRGEREKSEPQNVKHVDVLNSSREASSYENWVIETVSAKEEGRDVPVHHGLCDSATKRVVLIGKGNRRTLRQVKIKCCDSLVRNSFRMVMKRGWIRKEVVLILRFDM